MMMMMITPPPMTLSKGAAFMVFILAIVGGAGLIAYARSKIAAWTQPFSGDGGDGDSGGGGGKAAGGGKAGGQGPEDGWDEAWSDDWEKNNKASAEPMEWGDNDDDWSGDDEGWGDMEGGRK